MVEVGIHSIKNGMLYGRLGVFCEMLPFPSYRVSYDWVYSGSGCSGPSVMNFFYVFFGTKIYNTREEQVYIAILQLHSSNRVRGIPFKTYDRKQVLINKIRKETEINVIIQPKRNSQQLYNRYHYSEVQAMPMSRRTRKR